MKMNTFGVKLFLEIERSISNFNTFRSPCNVRNSEFPNREFGFEFDKSRIDGPSARPT